MEYTRDVHTYNFAIVDNTDSEKRIVILTDVKGYPYKQVFFTHVSDFELIKRCQAMRDFGIKSF